MNKQTCITHLINDLEGGFSNDKGDAGGETMYGLIEGDRVKAVEMGLTKAAHVSEITLDEAYLIWDEFYYKPARISEFNNPFDFCFFQWVAEHGLEGATETLQMTLKPLDESLEIDKLIGEKTIASANSWDSFVLCRQFLNKQREHVLAKAEPLEKGELNRIVKTASICGVTV